LPRHFQVVLRRPLKGASQQYFTFNPAEQSNIPVIMAHGTSADFSYHGPNKGTVQLILHSADGPTCVCNAGITGSINGLAFSKDCRPPPEGDLLTQHNPTCDVRDYVGGLHCCHHGWCVVREVRRKKGLTILSFVLSRPAIEILAGLFV
jgi:hypothetical protein